MRLKTKSGYEFAVTVFGSNKDTKNSDTLSNAEAVGRGLAEKGITVINGGYHAGMMGLVSRAAHGAGGKVFGIALAKRAPKPHEFLTDYEGHYHHYARQHRLFELGDAYIALPGAVGTFHEILEAHILNILGEIKRPIVLVGDFFLQYKSLIEYFTQQGFMHTDIDTAEIVYAKTGEEAVEFVISYFEKLKEQNYYNPTWYPALQPQAIGEHIREMAHKYEILFSGVLMTVFPDVYPSNRFRSSKVFAKIVEETARGKKVADIACGHGAMGLVALANGATHVVQTDINPSAVANAHHNAEKLVMDKDTIEIYEGDLFSSMPDHHKRSFDIIYFNPPFHLLHLQNGNSKLLHAFYIHGEKDGMLYRFLENAKDYLKPGGIIYLGFSNKDKNALKLLESGLDELGYEWTIKTHENKTAIADNRIYEIQSKE